MFWSCLFGWIDCVIVCVVCWLVVVWVVRYLLWVMVVLWIGIIFVGFFMFIDILVVIFWQFVWCGWECFWVLFYVFVIWGNVGFLCEQVCCYFCFYVWVQVVFCDIDILCMGYDVCCGELCGFCLVGQGGVIECGWGLFDLVSVSDYVFCVVYVDIVGFMFYFSVDWFGDCVDCVVCVCVCLMGLDI